MFGLFKRKDAHEFSVEAKVDDFSVSVSGQETEDTISAEVAVKSNGRTVAKATFESDDKGTLMKAGKAFMEAAQDDGIVATGENRILDYVPNEEEIKAN